MIVVDSFALVAMIVREIEADRFLAILAASDHCLLSSVSLLETSMVLLAGRATRPVGETSMTSSHKRRWR